MRHVILLKIGEAYRIVVDSVVRQLRVKNVGEHGVERCSKLLVGFREDVEIVVVCVQKVKHPVHMRFEKWR